MTPCQENGKNDHFNGDLFCKMVPVTRVYDNPIWAAVLILKTEQTPALLLYKKNTSTCGPSKRRIFELILLLTCYAQNMILKSLSRCLGCQF
jgi:hypothetical protein